MVNSLPPGEGCARHLGPSEDVFLVAEVVAVPVLDEHLNPSGDEVAPAFDPGLVGFVADPDVSVQEVGLLGPDVAGAVFEAHEVAGRGLRGAGGGGLAEPELHPVVLDSAEAQAGEVPDGVKRDQRVVGAGLDAQVAADVFGVEVLVR